MPEMIERDNLFVTLGAFRPFGPWTDQAHIAANHIPELRQFIETQFAKPPANPGDARIALPGINVGRFIITLGCAHRPKFESREQFPLPADPWLPKNSGTSALNPNDRKN